jgi:hypothetical protein
MARNQAVSSEEVTKLKAVAWMTLKIGKTQRRVECRTRSLDCKCRASSWGRYLFMDPSQFEKGLNVIWIEVHLRKIQHIHINFISIMF